MNFSDLILNLGFFLDSIVSYDVWRVAFMYMPFVLFLELPIYGLTFIGLMRHVHNESFSDGSGDFHPTVSCLVLCYGEGRDVQLTIRSLAEQVYPGRIEILVLIDGALQNTATLDAARSMAAEVAGRPRRDLVIVPKWQRGGRVSSMNLGLKMANGSVVLALDGDTSFDNDMIANIARHFVDPGVVAVSGALRVRNAMKNLVTRCQGLEYIISIHAGRIGLSAYNLVNNVSGAFGAFRTDVLRQIGGWSSGTAEDLDLTVRLNSYFARTDMRIVFEPMAIGHTDGPDSWIGLARQRMRWDGDMVYVFLRKHLASFDARRMGWGPLVYRAWAGIMFGVFAPLVIYGYVLYSLFVYPLSVALSIAGFLLVFYGVVTAALYGAFVALVSERPRNDLRYLPLVPVFGVYTMYLRLVSAFAVVWNLVARSHLDSSMAPWWVLRKGKF